MENFKICTKCNEKLPATTEYFNKKERGLYGLRADCKICHKKYADKYYKDNKQRYKQYNIDNRERNIISCRNYRENNKDIFNEHKKQYRIKAKKEISIYNKQYRLKNIEIARENNKKYREINKEKLSENYKQYYKINKEKLTINTNKWRKEHKELCNISIQKYRSKKYLLINTLTYQQWGTIKKYFNNRCCYCGEEKPLAQEHFIALSNGGEYATSNIIPSCKSCNSSKKNKDFFEWYPKHKSYSKEREFKILKYLNYNKNKIQQLALTI